MSKPIGEQDRSRVTSVKIFGWLEKLTQITSIETNKDDVMSDNGGARNRMVAQAVFKAALKEQAIAKRELCRDGRDIPPPFILGPQRYRYPDPLLPPEQWRPSIGGSGLNAAEKVPLIQDEYYRDAVTMVYALDAAVGQPPDD